MRYYLTTPIYYVNATPAHRARVHDDRRGRPRPAPPAARRGDVLPHRHRRACARRWTASPRSRGSTRRRTSTRSSRSTGASCPSASTPSTTSSSAPPTRGTSASSRSSCSASTTTATSTRTSTPGSTASAARSSRTEAELVDGLCPDHGIPPEWIEETQLVLPPLGLPGQAARSSTTSAPISCCRGSATTRRAASSRAASRTSASAAPASRGACRSPGTRSRSPTSG